MEDPDCPPAVLETNVPHSARIWNYWIGGKDHYPIDRHIGDEVAQMLPSIVAQARADRLFLARAVRYLASEQGVRQFLDIGTGLPSGDNTHEVAQAIAPQCRVVYADNDPLVLVHARALLASTPEGRCDYIDADLRDPDAILGAAAATLDFAEPVALMLLGILHHLPDDDEPHAIVAHLLAALPPGSFLAVNHATNAVFGGQSDQAVRRWNQVGKPPITLRSPQQIQRFFDGLELVEPGVVSCSRWRPEHNPWGEPGEVDEFCGIGRKP
jgi:O-methyltransferase involved in polyketide biosynthesis